MSCRSSQVRARPPQGTNCSLRRAVARFRRAADDRRPRLVDRRAGKQAGKNKMKIKMTIAAAAALTLLAGCGGGDGEGTVVARDGDTTVAQGPNGTTTVTTPEGTATINTGTAEALPGGLPAYPGAQAGGSMNVNGADGQQNRMVSFTTTDRAAQVIEFYAAAARRAGLEEASRTSDPQSATLSLTRGEQQITVVVMDLGGNRQVQVASGG
jgi:hypothetical protein